jgi:hypothetical protein
LSGFPMEIRYDVGAFLAAGLERKARFDIGQPNLIRLSVAADRGPMTTTVVRAIDQQAACGV